jgi:Tfp pilus assembly protein PilX
MKRESDRRHEESGIALMVAMFALLILTLIGLAMLTRATTEVLINDNFKRSKATFLAAEAGTEEARFRLTAAAGANRIDTLFPSDGTESTKVVYIRANTSIVPTDQSSSNRYRDSSTQAFEHGTPAVRKPHHVDLCTVMRRPIAPAS